MTRSPAHTLAQALLSLPGQLRERLSHLEITTGDTPHLTCHSLDRPAPWPPSQHCRPRSASSPR